MSDDKAVRRVKAEDYQFSKGGYFCNDPNGTHYLVEAELWERRVVGALVAIVNAVFDAVKGRKMDQKTLRFLKELGAHIAQIDHGCDHCIDNFLEYGETAWDDEPEPETNGGVNKLLAKHFPGLKFEHIRSKKVDEVTKVRLVVDDG